MEIMELPLRVEDTKPLYEDAENLGFGRIFTDRMFTMRYSKESGWTDPCIDRLQPIELPPSACVLHYSQEIFEGLKAYANEEGKILLFRPDENIKRMNRSAERMCMAQIPEDIYLQAIERLVLLDKRWIPQVEGTSIYIRPTLIATEPFLGVHPSSEYLFYIILSPVGAYFKGGFHPIPLWVEDEYVRAVVGGVGDAKTGGNYASSLYACAAAQEKGYSQVLWLDGKHRKYVEEVGAMNIFFVFGNKLVTPALSGSILPGITRKSIIQLARTKGYEVEERAISIDEVIEEVQSGALTESFGTGTAAVVSPVGSLCYKGTCYNVGTGEVGAITSDLYHTLLDIQYGRVADSFGWVRVIGQL